MDSKVQRVNNAAVPIEAMQEANIHAVSYLLFWIDRCKRPDLPMISQQHITTSEKVLTISWLFDHDLLYLMVESKYPSYRIFDFRSQSSAIEIS
jgi:hypothetical protein